MKGKKGESGDGDGIYSFYPQVVNKVFHPIRDATHEIGKCSGANRIINPAI